MRAFEGVRVVDFTRVISGPIATQLMALLDAEVIKIEPPGDGDQLRGVLTDPEMAARRMSPAFMTVNLNKRSLALDLKSEAGRAVVGKLVANADVVVENFVPGVAAKLGIDYESVRVKNPKVIYCSISGYGQSGPKSAERAYDSAIQADSGMMSLTGHPETGPTRIGFMLTDVTTGISAAYAIASALYRRSVTGEGQNLDVAMYDAALTLMGCQAADFMVRGNFPGLLGNGSPVQQPTAGAFETRDGMLLLATLTRAHQEACFRALGLEASLTDPRYATERARHENFESGRELVRAAFRTRTTEEWLPLLKQHGVAVQPVRDFKQALSDPQLAHRGIMVDASDANHFGPETRLLGAPFLAGEDGPLQSAHPPVEVGQDSREILTELGYSAEEAEEILRQNTA